MSIFNILVILALFGGLVFCVTTIKRLLNYNKKYRMPELQYTKLFGIITKEHVAFIYLIFTLANTAFMIWFIWTL
ncbi:MAG: hypothetical protein ABIH78_00830 [Candidatus Peregrinibacteria bacterium]